MGVCHSHQIILMLLYWVAALLEWYADSAKREKQEPWDDTMP